MWLLKLHFSISVLCMLTFIGFKAVCSQQLKENGWYGDENLKNRKIYYYLAFFVPILNILMDILLLMMIVVKKKDFDKACEDAKKDSEVSDNE